MSQMSAAVARVATGLVLAAAMMAPPVAGRLEATMVGHVVVQIPLLAAAGWLVGRAAAPAVDRSGVADNLNRDGVAGLIVAVSASLIWMLPRSLDAALTVPLAEVAKFASVPLLIGLPLGLSWHRLPTLVRGFVWANLVSMLAVLGWLYLASPLRLCNNYLVSQQERLGSVLLTIAVALAVFWIGHLFLREADLRVGPDGNRRFRWGTFGV